MNSFIVIVFCAIIAGSSASRWVIPGSVMKHDSETIIRGPRVGTILEGVDGSKIMAEEDAGKVVAHHASEEHTTTTTEAAKEEKMEESEKLEPIYVLTHAEPIHVVSHAIFTHEKPKPMIPHVPEMRKEAHESSMSHNTGIIIEGPSGIIKTSGSLHGLIAETSH